MSDRPGVVVADPDARSRVRAMNALAEAFEVESPPPGEPLARTVRRLQPAIVLLAMPRNRMNEALRTCRRLKTEPRHHPVVGLLDRWARLDDPEAALDRCLGDGYLAGRAGPEDYLAFARALARGERPVVLLEPELGLLGHLIRTNRLRRRR